MGQYQKQRDDRTNLQQKLDAELRAKAAARSKQDGERPDGVTDSAYVENTKQTTSLGWAWMAILIFVVVVVGFFIYMLSRP